MKFLFNKAAEKVSSIPRQILKVRSTTSGTPDSTDGEHLPDEKRMLSATRQLARIGGWVFDVAAQRLSWSSDTYKILGLASDQFDGAFASFLGYVHPDDRARLSEVFHKALAGQRTYTYEYRFSAAAGAEKCVRGVGEAQVDAAGRVLRLVGTVMDVTEQVELKQQIQHTADRLHARLKSSWEWYWEQDEEFRYVLFDGGTASHIGAVQSESLGKRRWELADSTPVDSTWEAHRAQLLAHEEFRDFVFRAGTGTGVRFFSVSGEPKYTTDGAFSGYRGIARDITLRMRAEQQARETQSMLELASRLGRLGAWALDLPEMTVSCSPEALTIHGLGADAPLTVDGIRRQIHPDWIENVDSALDACIRRGVPFDIEFQLHTALGKLIWVRLIGEASRDVDGQVRRIHGAVQDISETKMQAERYRELGERLTTTLESVTDAFFTLDRQWKFTYVNREAETLLRRPRAGLLEQVIWEQFPEAAGTIFQREYERALSEHVTVDFEEFYPPLQSWLRVTAYPSPQGLAVYFRDVTESRNARQVLALSEERHRLLFESSVDAIFHTCPDGRVLSANSAACKMFRMSQEELRQAGRAGVIAADDPRLPRLLEERRRLGRAQGELTMVRGDGTRFEAEISSAEYRDSQGGLFTMVAVRDVTERMLHREEIVRLNADLARRVRQRTAELEAVNTQLKGFAHSLAHDLRGPIAAIGVFGESLEDMLAPAAGERELHYVRRIRAAGQRMDDFVTALLALASVSQAELHMSEVDLSEMAAAVLSDLQEQSTRRRVITKVQEGLVVFGDARLLRMALENLLGNAWKFTARREMAEISFSAARRADGELVYCSEDNGAGFDMAHADRLFGNFQRLHGEDEFPGMGIGLANVHRIISRHAGRIWAESAEESGARFFFTLGGRTEPDQAVARRIGTQSAPR